MDAVELLVVVSIVGACLFSLLGRPVPEERAKPRGVGGRLGAPRAVRGVGGLGHVARRAGLTVLGGVEPEGEVLFAERTGSRAIALDCLVRPRPRELGYGVPARVSARCTVTWWAAERFTKMVESWAADPRRTTVRIVERAGGLRAVVTHGRSSITLDVVDPVGLLVQLGAPVASRPAAR